MKIKIALIHKKNISKAIDISQQLQKAIKMGEMLEVDRLSEEIISLTESDFSISIDEKLWCEFIASIRAKNDSFSSEYLFDKSQIQKILSVDMDKALSSILVIMEKALEVDGIVLELPYEEN